MATPTSFKLLRNEKDIRTFAAGETIFSKGDPGDRMYAVIEGDVMRTMADRLRRQTAINT